MTEAPSGPYMGHGVKQRDLIKMTPEEVEEFIDGKHTATMCTLYATAPSMPSACGTASSTAAIAMESKAKAQKVLNLRRDPRITVLIEEGLAYEELRGVSLVGTAEIIEDRERLWDVGVSVFSRYNAPYTDEMAPFVEALIHKRVAIKVNPKKIVTWDHRKLCAPVHTGMTEAPSPSSSGRAAIRAAGPELEAWLATILAGRSPRVSGFEGTSATGMSSETHPLRRVVDGRRHERQRRLVARIAPDAARLSRSSRPTTWSGRRGVDHARRRADGRPRPDASSAPNNDAVASSAHRSSSWSASTGSCPPDVMPYTFGDNWLYDAARGRPATPRRLDRRRPRVAARHPERGGARSTSSRSTSAGDTPLRRHVAHTRAWYEFACRDTPRSPLARAHVHVARGTLAGRRGRDGAVAGATRASATSSTADFHPVAVLDWEMAGLGPRELDVAWLVFAHRVFEHLAATLRAQPGMPHFLRAGRRRGGVRDARPDTRCATSTSTWRTRRRSGAIVFLRTGFRSGALRRARDAGRPRRVHAPQGAARGDDRVDAASRSTSTRSTSRRCRWSTSRRATATSTTAATSTRTTAPATSSSSPGSATTRTSA